MEVQCDTAITWPLGVADLAVRFKALSVDAAAGEGGRVEASLQEGSLLRLPVGAEAEVTLLMGGGSSGPRPRAGRASRRRCGRARAPGACRSGASC